MDWIKKSRFLIVILITLTCYACTISYKFNGSSINYDRVKTISIADFPIRSTYVYAPLGTVFNDELKKIFVRQTKLSQVNSNGDLDIEGEITDYSARNTNSIKADSYSSQTELRLTVNVRFSNTTNPSEDFEQKFTATRTYESTQLLTAVQDELISEMVQEIVDQIFNATVANW